MDAYLDGTLNAFASSYIYDNDHNHIYVSVKPPLLSEPPEELPPPLLWLPEIVKPWQFGEQAVRGQAERAVATAFYCARIGT